MHHLAFLLLFFLCKLKKTELVFIKFSLDLLKHILFSLVEFQFKFEKA